MLATQAHDAVNKIINSVAFNTVNTDYRASALKTLLDVAKTNRTFTIDDVVKTLGNKAPWPTDFRILGSVMLTAKKLGIIEKTKEYRLSEQEQCHKNPRVVWASRIF